MIQIHFLTKLILTLTALQSDIAVIPINGPIDQITSSSIERRVELAEINNKNIIILDINTPGGDLQSTLQICHFLKTKNSIETIAYINPNAYSAGAIIALACNSIFMSPNASLGDAAPISGLMIPLPPTERAKIEAPILTEVIDSARLRGWDEKLVQSFISTGIELWLLKEKGGEKQIAVDRFEYKKIYKKEPPDELVPLLFKDNSKELEENIFSPLFKNFENKTPVSITQTSSDRISSRITLTEKNSKNWELVGQIVSKDRLLTVRPGEAAAYGLTQKNTYENISTIASELNATNYTTYTLTWSESFAKFLNSTPVKIILMTILIAGVFLEAITGTAVFFSIAAACFGLLVWGPAMSGASDWWPIPIASIGMLMILVELLLFPGGGFLGLLGGLALILGLGGLFISPGQTGGEAASQLALGSSYVILSGLIAILICTFIGKRFGYKKNSKFILNAKLTKKQNNRRGLPKLKKGCICFTRTDLRPAGKVVFEDIEYDVLSEGGFIAREKQVVVIEIGNQIKVRLNDTIKS